MLASSNKSLMLLCMLCSLSMLAFTGLAEAGETTRPARLDAGKTPLTVLLEHPPLESLQQDYLVTIEFRADVTRSGKIRKYQLLYVDHQHLNVSKTEEEGHGCVCPGNIAEALERAVRKARVKSAYVAGKTVRAGIIATAIFEFSKGQRTARLLHHAQGGDALYDNTLIAPQVIGGWVTFLEQAERPRLKSGMQMPADHPDFHAHTMLQSSVDAEGKIRTVDTVYDDDGTVLWRDSLVTAYSGLKLIPAEREGRAIANTFLVPVSTRFARQAGHTTADELRFLDPYFTIGGDYEQRLKDQMLHRRLESTGTVTR